MFHYEMNGEKAEDLKKLFGWVKKYKEQHDYKLHKNWTNGEKQHRHSGIEHMRNRSS